MDGGGSRGGGGPRQMYEITCSNCGKKDSVPFQPRGDRPVLCSDCFRKQRDEGGGAPRSDRGNYSSNTDEHSEPAQDNAGSSEQPAEEEATQSE